jgi:acetyltransferase-like isoleucine patch superfamily enzyme
VSRTLRFARFYRGHLAALIVEDIMQWLVRGLPGPIGLAARDRVLRWTCRRAGGFSHIYPHVFMLHTYGLSFGRGLSINTGVHIDARGGLTIGNYVMIGPNSTIVSSEHDLSVSAEPMAERNHLFRPVVIEDDVWIGANVVVCGGVRIGHGSVIGAGAVVTSDIPPMVIAGGVPAVVLKSRQPGVSTQAGQA